MKNINRIIGAIILVAVTLVNINTTTFAQTVTVSAAGLEVIKPLPVFGSTLGSSCLRPMRLTNGVPATISWSMNNAPEGTVTEINIVGLNNIGQEVGGYSLTKNDRGPVSGKLLWTPRSLQGWPNLFTIKITWKTVLFNTVVTNAQTKAFTISSVKRAIVMATPKVLSYRVNEKSLVAFKWASANIPASAKIRIIAQPSWNTEAGGIIVTKTNDGLLDTDNNGGFTWWLGDCSEAPIPGKYFVTAYWVTEDYAYGLASNTTELEIQ